MEEKNNLLRECLIQLQYLNDKFGQTGTTNSLINRIESGLSKYPTDSGRSQQPKPWDMGAFEQLLYIYDKTNSMIKSPDERFVIETATGLPRKVWKIIFNESDKETHVWCSDWYGHHIIGKDCEFPHPKPLTDEEIGKIALEIFPKYSGDDFFLQRPAFIEGMKKAQELIFKAK